ncbi:MULTISPECIES: cytoplasmic protein [Priestia]|uniref:cytoplasmic protein n=1 Tax=Priestia TaxID=2800373 RepID=UPI0009905D5D|nr:cytoplasmic protein [Priestia megaterium]AQU77131.1 cytoplasmic protein [Priestia megaterium]MDC7783391.1 cytoplasmic protein [Priestia megaterium]RFB33475.1 cytoplasmic protein [Bacillus sp. RC]
MQNSVKAAHRFCGDNKESLREDNLCGCFYCLEIFHPSEIKEWIDNNESTALCPYCEIDSIIGQSSGFSITKEFLSEMNKYWF